MTSMFFASYFSRFWPYLVAVVIFLAFLPGALEAKFLGFLATAVVLGIEHFIEWVIIPRRSRRREDKKQKRLDRGESE